MFQALQDNLTDAFRSITGQARLTEGNMREALKMVEKALLEADVGYSVVKQFMAAVTEEAVGEEVLRSHRPSETVLAIVYRELTNLMGPVDTSLHLRDFSTLMMCGLQGSGKTTTCAKLARLLKQSGRKPFLVAADLQRPAAIHQLQVLGEQVGCGVFADLASQDPVDVCTRGVQHARLAGADVVILDTAGRLHIDDELMTQLKRIDQKLGPDQVYLVVDGMTGQDAVSSAKAFNEALELDGVILTKLDGDQHGGAVLSVKAVTGVPIKFLGMGEHLPDLEPFRPEGMASRILGGGDMVEIARRVQTEIDQEAMQRHQEEMARGQFTLETFRDMMSQMRRLGPMQKLLGLLPGMGQLKDLMGNVDAEAHMNRIRGMIDSMTADERRNPRIIDNSRRRRIAAGSGVEPHEINNLVKEFDSMAAIMKATAGKNPRDQMRELQALQQKALTDPNGLARRKVGTGRRLSSAEKAKLKKQREKEQRKAKRKGKEEGG